MLKPRLLTAALGIPLGLAVIWLGGWWLAGVVAVIAVLGLRECYHLISEALRPHLPSSLGRGLLAGLAGVCYVPLLLSYTLHLRNIGALLLFLAVGACWATDTAAYLVGRKIGKHKFAPKISPGKTVEGGIAGLFGGMLFVGALGTWMGIQPFWAVGLGALLALAAQAGDLFESWLKRRAGVKDSGALLPGHGGVLDRFDSLLFVAPVAYYCLRALL